MPGPAGIDTILSQQVHEAGLNQYDLGVTSSSCSSIEMPSIIGARCHLNQDSCTGVTEVNRRRFGSNGRMALTSISSCSCARYAKAEVLLDYGMD
jgi:hypothetical protein